MVNLRLRWEVFKEQWPYFRRNPINVILRWNRERKDRPALHAKLDNLMLTPSLHRRLNETDSELRERIRGLSVKT